MSFILPKAFVTPALPKPDPQRDLWQYSEENLQEYAEAYLKAYLAARDPVAWAYRAFPDSELITLTMDKDDLVAAVDGTIPLYED